MDDHLDGVAGDGILPAVDALFELLPRENRSRTLEECVQQRKLPRRQRTPGVTIDDLPGTQIELQLCGPDDRLRMSVAAPDCRAEPREELGQLERLDDVVIGTEVQTRPRSATASRAVRMRMGVRSPCARAPASTSSPALRGRPRSSRTAT